MSDGANANEGFFLISSSSLSGLLNQVAMNPSSVLESPKQSLLPVENTLDSARRARPNVSHKKYVGTGLHLKLGFSSGQSIELKIDQSVSGRVRDVSLTLSHELSTEDSEKLKQVFLQISKTLEGMFSGGANQQASFDFANIKGVKDIALAAQQDQVNLKQRLEFEKNLVGNGRKEIEAQWYQYNHLNGQQEQHNLALSKQPKDVLNTYGRMDYQWVIDQVKAGMGILGNEHTGDSSLKGRVTDFFISGVQALFQESQTGQTLLQSIGATPKEATVVMGQAIRALTADQFNKKSSVSDMPGQSVSEANHSKINGLPDFKADFSSKRSQSGNLNSRGRYNLTMEVSQSSHLVQGKTEDDSTQTQSRRLLLKYDSQLGKKEYEYNWRHDEVLINRFESGFLASAYYKVGDLQQGILSTLGSGKREETSEYMQRREYDAKDNNQPSVKNSYIKPSVFTERGSNVNYTA